MTKTEQELKAQLENDPLEKLRKLEELQIATEKKAAVREKELLLEVAKQQEKNKEAREAAAKAARAAEVAEFKYVNQQKDQIKGVASLMNPDETDPDRKARSIFVERLRARRENAQRIAEERKIKPDGNLYFL
ncbi:MAG: hypothetical protein MRERV_9c064 [Mycoplasmataceae bacterium RV_VA103A]|nr:MAG: hypothetical protein MRERV_9c064 [Mycoplasmataceae bacterium RV_VA103A]